MTIHHIGPKWHENEESTYKVEMFCANCHHQGPVEIPKGISVSGFFVRAQKCPNCGVRALSHAG